MTRSAADAKENPAPCGDETPRIIVARMLKAAPDSSIELLSALSRAFSKSISETEFNTLLACAAHKAEIDCPGWRPKLRSQGGELEYEKLRTCLAGHEASHAAAALDRLFDALIHQLALLIGEHLTMLQFRWAWQAISTNSERGSAEI